MKVSQSTLAETETDRKQFIRNLFPRVRHLRYSFLKYFYDSVEDLPDHSDIDLLVHKYELEPWLEILRESVLLKKMKIQRTSFAHYVELYFVDGSYLSIDLIFQLKWRHLIFMDADEVLDQSIPTQNGIKRAIPEHLFEYVLLFFTLNDSEIPETYLHHFSSLNKVIQNSVRKYISGKYELALSSKLPFADVLEHREHLQESLEMQGPNRGLHGIQNQWTYWKDLFRRRNPTISFTGVDGAGKSTILNEVKNLLTEKYRKEVVILRQRPSILPILSSFRYGKQEAEKRAANTLPRQGTNKSRLSSVLRFLWYFTDYVLGQWYIEWKYNRRGRLLLYDRYYYDYIVDGRRANLVLSPPLVRSLFAWVFKPELNVLLYAKPDVILSRKQELSREDIVDLTDRMKELFRQFGEKYPGVCFLPIENIYLDETLQAIETAYVEIN